MLLLVLACGQAKAHDPSLHGFSLVMFKKPFPAPELSLPVLDGDDADLSDYRGKFVLLNFWATWCPPCLEEMPSIEVLYQRYRDHGFSVLAVASDEGGAEDVAGFVAALGVTFPILLDSDQRVSNRYGAKNLPVTFLVDPAGRVVAAAQGARDWSSDEALSLLDEIILAQ